MLSACVGRHADKSPFRMAISVDKVVSDSLFLSFPGELRVTSEHILLQTPFDRDGFLKVYDRQSGEELAWKGSIGQGPAEWTTPSFGNSTDSGLVIYDPNMKKYVFAKEKNMYEDVSEFESMKKIDVRPLAFVSLNDNLSIAAEYGDTPFKMLSDGKVSSCGKYPFDKAVSNTFDCFQGLLAIHPEKKLMIYGMSFNPYIALYRINSDGIEPVWEKQFKEADYSVSDEQWHWGRNQPTGMSEMTLTKDYIVCLRADENNTGKTFSIYMRGREMNIPLLSIYLFDYDGNLKYILDPSVHIIRLASDIHSNTLYAVNIEKDYSIVRFDIDGAISGCEQ
jgi:hypothetical protein